MVSWEDPKSHRHRLRWRGELRGPSGGRLSKSAPACLCVVVCVLHCLALCVLGAHHPLPFPVRRRSQKVHGGRFETRLCVLGAHHPRVSSPAGCASPASFCSGGDMCIRIISCLLCSVGGQAVQSTDQRPSRGHMFFHFGRSQFCLPRGAATPTFGWPSGPPVVFQPNSPTELLDL